MSNMAKCIKIPNNTSSSPSPFHAILWIERVHGIVYTTKRYQAQNWTCHRVSCSPSASAKHKLPVQCYWSVPWFDGPANNSQRVLFKTMPRTVEFTAPACATFAYQGALSPLWSTMVQVDQAIGTSSRITRAHWMVCNGESLRSNCAPSKVSWDLSKHTELIGGEKFYG